MSPLARKPESPPSARQTWLRVAAAALLAVGAIAAPLAFGATQVWAYCALQILVAVAVACWSLSDARSWRLLWIPAAVAGLGLLQVVPLPASVLNRVSPLSSRAQASARQWAHRSSTGCVSVDVERNGAALRRCLELGLVVVTVAGVAGDDRLRRLLYWSVAAIGVVVVLMGLLYGSGTDGKTLGFYSMDGHWKSYKNPLLTGFHSTGIGYDDPVPVGGITYVSDSPVGGKPMGVLINDNHFGACVGLTMPLVVCGLLAASCGARWKKAVFWPLALGFVAIGIYAIAVPAGARGATIGLGLASLFVIGLALSRTRRRGLIFVGALTALLLCGAAVLMQMNVVARLGGRYLAWKAALTMFRQSPWLGVGLGNFGVTYPFIDHAKPIYLAHNPWLETLAEAGLAGVALVALLLAGFIWTLAQPRAWEGLVSRRIERLGALGGLLFAAFHGALDHGVQIPANAYLAAVLVGILLGDVRTEAFGSSLPRLKYGRPAAVCGGLVLAGFLARGAYLESTADRLMIPLRRAVMVQRHPDSTELDENPALLQAALPAAEHAVELCPRHAQFAEYLGQAHLHLSRGEPGEELLQADAWFSRSLSLCPVSTWIPQTLREIRERSEAESNPARDAAELPPDE